MPNDLYYNRPTRPAKAYTSEIAFEAFLFGRVTSEPPDISSCRDYLLTSPQPAPERTTLLRITCGACGNTHWPQDQYRNAAALTSNTAVIFVDLSHTQCAGGLITLNSLGLEQETTGTLSEVVKNSVDSFLKAGGRAKGLARTELVNLLRGHESRIEALRAAMEQVSSSRSTGHFGDAIDVLSDLGDVVKDLADTSIRESPPNGTNDDYWYVLIRGLGKTGNGDILRQFARSPYRSLREAVAEAFRDLKDESSLSQIASEDSSQFIREIAQELLDELREVSSDG
jgi:hypothetical protein